MAYKDLKDSKRKGQPRQEWFPLSQGSPKENPSDFDDRGFHLHEEGKCSMRPQPPVLSLLFVAISDSAFLESYNNARLKSSTPYFVASCKELKCTVQFTFPFSFACRMNLSHRFLCHDTALVSVHLSVSSCGGSYR